VVSHQDIVIQCHHSEILFRGDSFRVAYAHIRDIRSILPSHVNIMALTATATKETYDVVCSRLSMKNPSVIGCAPNRDNIFYALKLLPNMDEFAETISNNVKRLGLYYPKTVVFCQKYADCSTFFENI
jgi:bloom syndrome protein